MLNLEPEILIQVPVPIHPSNIQITKLKLDKVLFPSSLSPGTMLDGHPLALSYLSIYLDTTRDGLFSSSLGIRTPARHTFTLHIHTCCHHAQT